METDKVGQMAAKAMDYIDDLPRHVEDAEEFKLSEVMVIVCFDKPDPTKDNSDRMSTLTAVLCTDERVYVKEGILRFAIDTIYEKEGESLDG
jgi:hypothetical protein